jgi:methionyl-tRNA formyltransferase
MLRTIVFFGSGPVAAQALALLSRDFTIETVITKPQPAHHKEAFPVLKMAKELGLNALTASDQETLSLLFKKHTFQSELGIIIDHGVIISHDVIVRFPFGIINSHFSLLPRWRGADPISYSILNGDVETGVSLMVIVDRLDEGNLLAQRRVAITPSTTTPSLTSQLINVSQELLVETLPKYVDGEIKPSAQPNEQPTYSHKLRKADGVIDWHKPAARLEREIRAYLGWPRSQTKLNNIEFIITKAHVAFGSGTPGTFFIENRQLSVYCGEDALVIDKLIPRGKKEMSAVSFLNGYQLTS